jgi:putative endonuclease
MKSTRKDNLATGSCGERDAALFLEKQGFTILILNYKTLRGEIDIIAQKNSTIIFVEVKTRKTNYFHASQLITTSKQRKIFSAAKQYIAERKLFTDLIFRFDAIFVYPRENTVEFEYVTNAFFAPE